jgi:hypothetical protein
VVVIEGVVEAETVEVGKDVEAKLEAEVVGIDLLVETVQSVLDLVLVIKIKYISFLWCYFFVWNLPPFGIFGNVVFGHSELWSWCCQILVHSTETCCWISWLAFFL